MHPKYKMPALELILTHAALRRQVRRRRQLFPFRRSARRRLVGRQRPVAQARRHHSTATASNGSRPSNAASRPASWKSSAPSAATAPPSTSSPIPRSSRVTHFDAGLDQDPSRGYAYIHIGLKITFKNEITKEIFDLTHPGGIPEFLNSSSPTAKSRPSPIGLSLLAKRRRGREDGSCPAMDRIDRRDRSAPTSTASARPTGGTHEAGFKSGIVKAIRNFMETHEVKTKGLTITAEDIREGIVGILSIFVRDPAFQGQTKERLNNPEMTAAVDNFVRPGPGILAQRQHVGRRSDRGPNRHGGQGPAGFPRGRPGSQTQVGHVAPAQPARQAGRLQIDRSGGIRAVHRRRATRPAARPSKAATISPRPCCRCAARSSIPRG